MPAVSALIVYESADMLSQLENALDGSFGNIWVARSCREAAELMASRGIPELIFTETKFPDGSWRDLLNLACTALPAAGVILVTRLEDIRLYLDAMEAGVSDYIVPPFEALGINYVVQSTLNEVAKRRQIAGIVPVLR